jgi:hypothetical protein
LRSFSNIAWFAVYLVVGLLLGLWLSSFVLWADRQADIRHHALILLSYFRFCCFYPHFNARREREKTQEISRLFWFFLFCFC